MTRWFGRPFHSVVSVTEWPALSCFNVEAGMRRVSRETTCVPSRTMICSRCERPCGRGRAGDRHADADAVRQACKPNGSWSPRKLPDVDPLPDVDAPATSNVDVLPFESKKLEILTV